MLFKRGERVETGNENEKGAGGILFQGEKKAKGSKVGGGI